MPDPEADDILKQTLEQPAQHINIAGLEIPKNQLLVDSVKGPKTEESGSPPKGEASPNRFSTVTMSEVP